MSDRAEARQWSGLEIPALFAVLMGGAVIRYWLSTAIPFDEWEFEALTRAQVRSRSVRGIFVMVNGLSLLALYLILRRSAGIAVAFAALLCLQASLSFQEQALRIRPLGFVLLVALIALTWWRQTRPAWRPPRAVSIAATLLASVLAARELYIAVTLIQRIESIRETTEGDAATLLRSAVDCGGARVAPVTTLRGCELAWPSVRSLAQQEAALQHVQMLGPDAVIFDGRAPLPGLEGDRVAVFDEKAAAFLLVREGEEVETALRVLRGSS
jgi:hypothetical protein